MLSQRVQSMSQSGIRRYFKIASQIEGCLDLSIGQPHFPIKEELQQLAISSITSGKNRYTQSLGIESARNAIKQKYNVGAEHDVIVTSGVSGALMLLYSLLLDPGDEILIPDPYFVGYKELSRHLSAVPVLVDTYPNFKLSVESLENARTDRTKALIVSSPSNPTGVSIGSEELAGIEAFCLKHSIALIFDEIYDEFYYGDKHIRPKLTKNVFITNGLSKSHSMLGWRLGWILTSSEYLPELEKLQQTSFVCAPSPFQEVIATALSMPPVAEREIYKNRRNYLVDSLKSKYDLVVPDGAIYAFPKVPDQFASDTAFVEFMIQKKLLVIPGSVFSAKNSHFRISYGVADNVFEQAIKILRDI
jgi:aspartate/methionine/tyrosine aminotransferase